MPLHTNQCCQLLNTEVYTKIKEYKWRYNFIRFDDKRVHEYRLVQNLLCYKFTSRKIAWYLTESHELLGMHFVPWAYNIHLSEVWCSYWSPCDSTSLTPSKYSGISTPHKWNIWKPIRTGVALWCLTENIYIIPGKCLVNMHAIGTKHNWCPNINISMVQHDTYWYNTIL